MVPFGHGLSYTSWAYHIVEAPAATSLTPLRDLLDRTAARAGAQRDGMPLFPKLSDVGVAARYVINVSNTGHVDADDVVLGFVSPPGAGTQGRPLKTLFGFERVHVRAGETVSIVLYPKLLDFAATETDGSRVPLPGEYKISFGVRAPEWDVRSFASAEAADTQGMGYAEVALQAM